MKPEGSLSHWQAPYVCPILHQSSPVHASPSHFLKNHFNIIHHLHLSLPSVVSFPQISPPNNLHKPLLLPIRTCHMSCPSPSWFDSPKLMLCNWIQIPVFVFEVGAQSRTLMTRDRDSVHSNTEQKGEKVEFFVRSSAWKTPNSVSNYVFLFHLRHFKSKVSNILLLARLLTYFSYYLSTFSSKDLKTEHLKSGYAGVTQHTL